jgi:hypothetical protein
MGRFPTQPQKILLTKKRKPTLPAIPLERITIVPTLGQTIPVPTLAFPAVGIVTLKAARGLLALQEVIQLPAVIAIHLAMMAVVGILAAALQGHLISLL